MSFDFMMDLLADTVPAARHLDPSGERPLKTAKEMRRRVLRDTGRRDTAHLQSAADEHFGLPTKPLNHWAKITRKLPWRAPEGSAPSPTRLVSGDR
jgi:hypothetical protein